MALSRYEIALAPNEDGDGYEAALFEVEEGGKSSDALEVGTGDSALLAAQDLLSRIRAPWPDEPVPGFTHDARRSRTWPQCPSTG